MKTIWTDFKILWKYIAALQIKAMKNMTNGTKTTVAA